MGQGQSARKQSDDQLNKNLVQDQEYGATVSNGDANKNGAVNGDGATANGQHGDDANNGHDEDAKYENSISTDYEEAIKPETNRAMVIRHRIAFFFIGFSALSLQSFVNVIANKALGAGKHASVIFLALYFPQVFLRVFADYWTKGLSYHLRVIITAICGATALVLLWIFMDNSAEIADESLLHASRLCVLMSVVLIGVASTFGEVTGFGYCTFFDPSCTNFMSSGNGFGAFMGAAIALIQNEAHFSNKSIVLGCFIIPTSLIISYFFGLTHRHTKQGSISIVHDTGSHKKDTVVSTEMSNLANNTDGNIQNVKVYDEEAQEQAEQDEHDAVRGQKIGALKTIKLLAVDLFTYTFPLFSVYFLYNIILAGFIAPSFDVLDSDSPDPDHPVTIQEYKKVYQYFVFSLRMGVFLGKSSGWMHITKFFIFPLIYVFGGIFAALLAYAPSLMRWFIVTPGGHWVIWVIGMPLGWNYGATSANILYVLRKDCPIWLKEFALSNTTFASSFGQMMGNVASIILSQTVVKRYQ